MLPGYRTGQTFYDLVLLAVLLVATFAYWLFHCTGFMDGLVDLPWSRRWVAVSIQVEILAWILLVPAMLWNVRAIVLMTCYRQRTIERARHANEAQAVAKSKTVTMTIVNALLFSVSSANSYFFVALFLFEAAEFVVQALAFDQMSRAGIDREALTAFILLILLNGVAPLATGVIVSRNINRAEEQGAVHRTRKQASVWIARLLVFDATCDLCYSMFGFGHLLSRYFHLFGDESNTERQVIDAFTTHQGRVRGMIDKDAEDLRQWILSTQGEQVLFGGKDLGTILVKLMSRVWPLLHAPLRVMTAFKIRQSASAGKVLFAVLPPRRQDGAETVSQPDSPPVPAEARPISAVSPAGACCGRAGGRRADQAGGWQGQRLAASGHTHRRRGP